MFEIFVYFTFCYLLVLCFAYPVIKKLVKLNRAKIESGSGLRNRTYRLVIAAYFVLPFLLYLIVEIQTAIFRPLFDPITYKALVADGDNTKPMFMRVMWATPVAAKLDVVSGHGTELGDPSANIGYMLDFVSYPRGWRIIDDEQPPDFMDECVWSDAGNADDNVFPPNPARDDFGQPFKRVK